MKRITSTRAVAVLVALFACLTLQAVNTITHTAVYSNTRLTTGTDTLGGVTYTTVNYEGLFNGGAPGTPSLPIDYLKFSVPWNATNFTVSATTTGGSITPLQYLVYPNQQPRLMSDTTGWSITLPDSSAYYTNTYYPTNITWVADEGLLAGENRIVTVAVMPVAFLNRMTAYAMMRQLKTYRNVNLTLSYDLSDTLATYPIVRNDTALRSEGYRLTQRLVVNPTDVVTNAPTSMTPDTLIVINPGSGVGGGLRYEIDSTAVYYDTIHVNPSVAQMAQYQYLIVTTPEFKHAVRRIAALKRQKGYTVKVVTMDQVLNHPYASNGDLIRQPDGTYTAVYNDAAGKLRQFLKLYYGMYGTRYVLLVGTDVPYRIHWGDPTDLYYSDLSANWNSLYDRKPELIVGRILSTTADQIENYSDKLLRYEINPGNGNTSYLRKAFFSEGRGFTHGLDSAKALLQTIFPNQISLNEQIGNQFPTGKDYIDSINSAAPGFLCIFNHGDTTRIMVYDGDNGIRYFVYAIDQSGNGDGLNYLQNKYTPMVCYSLACTTMPYDSNEKPSFGESFTTGKNYGGPIYIGNTREIFPDEAKKLCEYFMGLINEGYDLGTAHSLSKINFWGIDSYEVSFINQLLGDPELRMWTNTPQLFSNVNVAYGDSSIIVSGMNTDFTIVSICDNTGKTITKLNTGDSITFNGVSPNSSIMLYKKNYIPNIAPLVLQNATLNTSQYVIASDVTAGHSIDSVRTFGDVTVENGIEYEIEASGTVSLQDGFKVEKGATFAVYPSCF